jgi:protein-disulfide isomerase
MTAGRARKTARRVCLLLIAVSAKDLLAVRTEITEGNPTSPVKVVIYDDLQCGDCQNFRTMLDQKILPRYGDKVAFVHRDFPLGKHDWAREGAIAARWVYEHNPALGITFRRELLSEQDHITPENLKPWVLEFAARYDLDQKGILDSLKDQRLAALVDQDYQAAVARGVKRTPTVYVAGQVFVETIVYDEIARALDQALAR